MQERWLVRLLFAVVLAAFGGPLRAQGLEYVKANYTKHEHYIRMRDGVRLYTTVYVPKDHSRSYPILLNRTPYSISPYGADRYRADIGAITIGAIGRDAVRRPVQEDRIRPGVVFRNINSSVEAHAVAHTDVVFMLRVVCFDV